MFYSIVVRFMTDVPDCKKRAGKHLAPIIEERLSLLKEYGNDWPDRPVRYFICAISLILIPTL